MFQTAYSELCEKLTSLDIIPAKLKKKPSKRHSMVLSNIMFLNLLQLNTIMQMTDS